MKMEQRVNDVFEKIREKYPENNLDKNDLSLVFYIEKLHHGHDRLEANGLFRIEVKGHNMAQFQITLFPHPLLSAAREHRKNGESQQALESLDAYLKMQKGVLPARVCGEYPEDIGIAFRTNVGGDNKPSEIDEQSNDPFRYVAYLERALINERLGDLKSALADLESFFVEYQKNKLKLNLCE